VPFIDAQKARRCVPNIWSCGSKMMKRSCRIVGKTHQGLELRDVRIGVDVTAASSPRRALLNLMIV